MNKEVALSYYINWGGDKYFLSKTYIKQAEKQIKELINSAKPVHNFDFNMNQDTGRTHYEELAVKIFLKKQKEHND